MQGCSPISLSIAVSKVTRKEGTQLYLTQLYHSNGPISDVQISSAVDVSVEEIRCSAVHTMLVSCT